MNYIEGAEKLILDAAIQIATQKGLSAISIREVASLSGLSVGTVYNNYKSKDGLIAAVIGDFWKKAFTEIDITNILQKPAAEAIEVFYYEIQKHFASFKTNILTQLINIETSRKQSIRLKEAKAMNTLAGMINEILKKHFPPQQYSSEELEEMSIIILDIVSAMLKRGEKDFTFTKHLLSKMMAY